jgi:hypothetical protein
MNNPPYGALNIGYKNKYTEETVNSKFLGLHLDNHLNWKDHTDQMITKLSGACYAVRAMFHITNINTFKSIYFFHTSTLLYTM